MAGLERAAVPKRDQRLCSHSGGPAGCSPHARRVHSVHSGLAAGRTHALPTVDSSRSLCTDALDNIHGRVLQGQAGLPVGDSTTRCADRLYRTKNLPGWWEGFKEWVGRPAQRAGTTPPQTVYMQSAERPGLCQGAKSAACDAGRHVATPPLRVTVSSAWMTSKLWGTALP